MHLGMQTNAKYMLSDHYQHNDIMSTLSSLSEIGLMTEHRTMQTIF